MPRGNSGRIVIEVDTSLKQELYISLAKKNMTLKDWFIESAQNYLYVSEQGQLPLGYVAETRHEYSTRERSQ